MRTEMRLQCNLENTPRSDGQGASLSVVVWLAAALSGERLAHFRFFPISLSAVQILTPTQTFSAAPACC